MICVQAVNALRLRRAEVGLQLIAIFKLLKGLGLFVAGLASLHLANRDVADVLTSWISEFHIDPDNRYLTALIERLWSVDTRTLKLFSVATFFYAALLLTEGIGLLLRKRWAEYFTTIVTASFIPIEVYELTRRWTPIRVSVIGINVAVVWYLVVRLGRVGKWTKTSAQDEPFSC